MRDSQHTHFRPENMPSCISLLTAGFKGTASRWEGTEGRWRERKEGRTVPS